MNYFLRNCYFLLLFDSYQSLKSIVINAINFILKTVKQLNKTKFLNAKKI